MPLTSNPDELIVRSLVEKLEQAGHQVLLGYSAGGLSKLRPPATLVQLDTIKEQERKGTRAKYLLELTVSSVARTDDNTTYELMAMSHNLRTLLNEFNSQNGTIRKVVFSDTHFDIAPSNGQLSFADISVNVEAVF